MLKPFYDFPARLVGVVGAGDENETFEGWPSSLAFSAVCAHELGRGPPSGPGSGANLPMPCRQHGGSRWRGLHVSVPRWIICGYSGLSNPVSAAASAGWRTVRKREHVSGWNVLFAGRV